MANGERPRIATGTSVRINGDGRSLFKRRRHQSDEDLLAKPPLNGGKNVRYQAAEFTLQDGRKLRASDALAEIDKGKEYPW